MKSTHTFFACLILLVSTLFPGCETSSQMKQMGSPMAMEQSDSEFSIMDDRKLVYNGNLSLIVRNEPDSVMSSLRLMAESAGGYMSSRSNESITLRIPVTDFESFMNASAALGEVEARYVNANDITDRYFDVSIRLENSRKARETYLSLLEKAENVSEALEVERELERVNGEIDRLEGQMRLMNNQVELATITVGVREKIKPGPIGYIGVGVWKAVSWLFVRG